MTGPSLSRRRFGMGLSGLAGATFLGGPARAAAPSVWTGWRDRFLRPEGRVVDDRQGGISHSEGQGWGLLGAAAAGDRPAFEAIRGWTETHLAVRRDPLLAWRWVPGETGEARDYNNASDGDLFYAWALLRGGRRFGDRDALERSARIARALAEICVVADPRDAARRQLLPAAEHFRQEDRLVLNLSYVLPRALHDLAAAFDLPLLSRAAEDGVALSDEVAAEGLVPDWLELGADGWAPAPGARGEFGYDALRVPLYLAWSGRAGHPMVRRALRLWRPDAAGTVVRAARGGEVLRRDPSPGYAALAGTVRRAAGAPVRTPPPQSGESYYPATLALLAELAARDLELVHD